MLDLLPAAFQALQLSFQWRLLVFEVCRDSQESVMCTFTLPSKQFALRLVLSRVFLVVHAANSCSALSHYDQKPSPVQCLRRARAYVTQGGADGVMIHSKALGFLGTSWEFIMGMLGPGAKHCHLFWQACKSPSRLQKQVCMPSA